MKYRLQDIIDIEQFQRLQDRLNEIYSFPSAIIDNEGNILTATAWQDICTKFHRINKKSEKECIVSDQYILSHLHEANPAVSYECPHGLIDNATPIIIEGIHYGNFFTGQFFLKKPNLVFFKKQAKKYGFDEQKYLTAVKKVPIWTKQQLNSYLFFIKGLIEVISGVGLKNLREIEARKTLKESEDKFRTITEQMTDMVFVVGPDGKIDYVSPASKTIFGYQPVEMEGRYFIEFLHEASIPQALAAFKNGVTSGAPTRNRELQMKRKDGSIFTGEMTGSLYRKDYVTTSIGIIRDITERKRAEERLAKLNERFLMFSADPIANINLLVALCGELLGATCALYNRLQSGLLCSFGQWNTPPDYRSVDPPEGHICYDIIKSSGDDIVVIRNLQESSYALTDPNVQAYKLQTYIGKAVKFGDVHVGSLCVVFQCDVIPSDDDKRLMGIVASAIGVEEERKQEEEELGTLAHALRSISECVSITDMENTILFVNQSFLKTYGYSEDELVGKNISIVRSLKTSPEVFQDVLPSTLRGGWNGELWNLRKDGSEFPISLSTSVVRDARGEPLTLIGIAADITERKRSEEAVAQSEERYRLLTELSPDAILVHQDGIIIYANKSAFALFGAQQPDELIGSKLIERVHSDYRAIVSKRVGAIYDRGEVARPIEELLVRLDGSVFFADVTGCQFFHNGKPAVQVIARDITIRKQAEDALRESEERLTVAQSVAHIGSWELTLATRTMWASDEAFLLYGLEIPANHILPLAVVQGMAHHEDRHRMDVALDDLLKHNKPFNYEYRIFRADDHEQRIILSIARLVRDKTGQPISVMGTIQDITERKQSEEILRQKEQHLRTIYENMRDSMFLIRRSDGRILEANRAAMTAYGYSHEEFLAMTVSDLRPQRLRETVVGQIAQADIGGILFETIHQRKDGSEFPVEVSSRGMMLGGERVLLSIVRDITERKKAEKALTHSHDLMRYIIEHNRSAVAVHDKDLKYIYVSQRYLQDYNVKEQDVIGKHHYDVFPDLPQKWRDVHQKALAGEISSAEDDPYVREDDTVDWTRWECRPWYEADGSIGGIIVYTEVITQRKKAEEALAAEKERLAVTLRSIADGVITTDLNGKIVLMNRVAENLTGWHLEEAVGKPLCEVFYIVNENTRNVCANPAELVLTLKTSVELANHTILVSRDGREYQIADSAAPIFDKKSDIIGVVLVFRDMTEKHKLLENVQRADKLQSLGVLAGGLAHDFNNLLGGLFGYLELAREYSGSNEKARRYIEKSLISFNRAKDLTQQLLTFSKGGVPNRKTSSLESIIRENTLFALSGSNVTPHFKIEKDLWLCDFDENQIGQVIDNLVINAQQAMPAGGAIIVSADNVDLASQSGVPLAEGKYVRFSIADTGTGIPLSILQRIFDPFFTTKQKGSGLGLTTSYSIVKKHDGVITVASTVDVGTTFSVYLPASEKQTLDDTSRLTVRSKGHGRILVMDDEESIRETTKDMLETLGYQVEHTTDGMETLERYHGASLEGKPFDAVIMDLTIPGGMGGKETIARLRKTYPNVIAFVSSGYSNDPVLSNPAEFGFTDKLQKPFRMDELAQLLHMHLIGKTFEEGG
jgi:PAS domain S-box-containing protein